MAPRQSGAGSLPQVGVHFDVNARGSASHQAARNAAASAASRSVELLATKARNIGRLKGISDALLISLLSNSDSVPDRVQQGVVLFNQGEHSSYWYLLLSGEVQLFLPPYSTLCLLPAGSLFGQLDVPLHCCSALITRPAEFIRIAQQHFLTVYCKHADHLQSFITVMEDTIAERQYSPQVDSMLFVKEDSSKDHMQNGTVPPSTSQDVQTRMIQSHQYEAPPPAPTTNVTSMRKPSNVPRKLPLPHGDYSDYDVGQLSMAELMNELEATRIQPGMESPRITARLAEGNIIELNNCISIEARIEEAAVLIKNVMLLEASHLIQQRLYRKKLYAQCMVGTEMVDWLLALSLSYGSNAHTLSRFQITGMWQVLLEHNMICHVMNEHQFIDKYTFYRWIVGEGGRRAAPRPAKPILPSAEELASAIFFLSTIGPDALFRMILHKSPHDRTPEELELVYEELLHVKALSHLSTMVKRELATVIAFEQHYHAGTVLFHQGDQAKKWYIILKGSVNVSIHGKGIVCSLQEGDDFGKLALINEAPRAATITLREDDAQFLVVDKQDFNRILRDVEANTVRLKEHGADVLVLERISEPKGAAIEHAGGRAFSCYSVMAGTPEKMIEYVLETRVDAQAGDSSEIDIFLEDFILTHLIYMPTNVLCNYLKTYYVRNTTTVEPRLAPTNELDKEQRMTSKRRVVAFLSFWVRTLGLHFFFDPVVNSFVEELYCCVLEDSRSLPGMSIVLANISAIRTQRESAQRRLARHPTVVIECGVLSSMAPAPDPILPSDTCNQIIHLSDTTSFAMSIRMDKSAREICEMASARLRCTQADKALCLVEVKSNAERVIFSPTEISIPTMLGLNSKLYVVYRDEIDSLQSQLDQNGPIESVHASVLELVSSSELAHQLFILHAQLLEATDEIELITQVLGRETFPGRLPSNLDLLMRRFNEVQCWVTTEVLLAATPKRVTTLRKFIKIAIHAKENRDLMSLFAVTLGLSNIAVSRLNSIWDKIPTKLRRQFAEFESLLDPSRNHRPYRALAAKMPAPCIPFIPLLLKDLTFIHEGNKTNYNGLVNFEKMHMIANVLRNFRLCKAPLTAVHCQMGRRDVDSQNLIRNFRVIDCQRRLMELSYQIEPHRARRSAAAGMQPFEHY